MVVNLNISKINDGNFNLETLSVSNLEYLEIRSDQQKELPESIGACTNLKKPYFFTTVCYHNTAGIDFQAG